MKLLATLLALVALTYAAPSKQPTVRIHIPQKCEDVLSVQVCNKLTEAAKNLKLKSEEVKAAVIDAVKNGKTNAEDIYNSAKVFLQQQVLSKKCEDFTSSDNCKKLRDLAGKLKIQADKVEIFVIKAVAEGQVKALDLYNKVVDYYKTEIATKKCEDFLTKSHCDKIRAAAGALKIKTDQWEKAFLEGLVNAKVKGTEVVTETFNKLKELAKNTSCEDLLNPTLCAALRKYAKATKVAFPKIMETVRDVLVKGIKVGKGILKAIYDVTDYFYDCEDVFTKSSCDTLKKWVGRIGIEAKKIDAIVRKYVRQGIDLGTSLYKKILAYLKEKVFCKINIFCKDKDDIMVKRSISEKISTALKRYKEMLQKAIPKVQEKIKELLKKALSKGKEIGEKAKKAIEELVTKAKIKSEELKKFIKEMLNKQNSDGPEPRITKRDIYQSLKDALAKAHGMMKGVIQKLLAMSKEHLQKIHSLVSNLLKKILGDGKTKREIGEIEAVEQFVDSVLEQEFEKLEKQAELEADNVIGEVIADADDKDEEDILEKRDLTAAIDKMKQVYEKLGDKFKNVLNKIKSLSMDDIKKMLEDSGKQMVGTVKDIYEKIKELLEKQQ